MAAVESLQQSRPREPPRPILHRPRGSAAPEATDRGGPRQCLDLLPGAGQHLQRSQLPEPQPLEHSADTQPQGRADPRGATRRDTADRDGPHPDKPNQNCEFR